MAHIDEKQLYDELERFGEDAVKIRVAKALYGNQTAERRLVDEWLRGKAQARAEADASKLHAAGTRSAEAAERQAAAAEQALAISKRADYKSNIGLVISAVAAVAAIAAVIAQIMKP
jgi:hypothetical protein